MDGAIEEAPHHQVPRCPQVVHSPAGSCASRDWDDCPYSSTSASRTTRGGWGSLKGLTTHVFRLFQRGMSPPVRRYRPYIDS